MTVRHATGERLFGSLAYKYDQANSRILWIVPEIAK
jgi:hypothetical protein